MKRLISTTTALALVLASVPPFPLLAQTEEVCGKRGQPPCAAGEEAPRRGDRTVTPEVAPEADNGSAQSRAQAREAAAAERAAAEAKAAEKAQAEAQAAERSRAEAAAAEQAEAEAQAAERTRANAAAAEQAATEAAAAEAAAARKAASAAEQAAAEAAAAEADGAEQAAADAAAKRAAAEAAAAEQAADEAAAAEAAARAATEADPAPEAPASVEAPRLLVPAPETDEPAARATAERAPEPIPEPAPEAVQSLSDILAAPEGARRTREAPAPAATLRRADRNRATTDESAQPPAAEAAPVATIERRVTERDRRSSDEEFAAAPRRDVSGRRDRDSGLSDLEKVGLLALGALAVGVILNNGDKVVSNSGDRVVVARSDGGYDVLKDDDALLYQTGSDVRTETFRDGSTRTTFLRSDGSRIVTIRDASGRVLQRVRYDARGRETYLIDDTTGVQPIDVTTLPRPAQPVTISASGGNAELALALANANIGAAGRAFSLRQVREVREVRALAPQIEVEPIRFRTGSAAIDPTEAQKLAELGGFISRTIAERPGELFLIEGHTDAVGSAPSNLTLSDRRAESLALALTEYFDVPPENLVVQGYGEGDLLIPTDGDEPRNRRVAVRIITGLLQPTAG